MTSWRVLDCLMLEAEARMRRASMMKTRRAACTNTADSTPPEELNDRRRMGCILRMINYFNTLYQKRKKRGQTDKKKSILDLAIEQLRSLKCDSRKGAEHLMDKPIKSHPPTTFSFPHSTNKTRSMVRFLLPLNALLTHPLRETVEGS